MSHEVLVLVALSFTATFAYLSTRFVALVWGMPHLSRRLRSVLELGTPPSRLIEPQRSLDVWIIVLVLALLEGALIRALSDATAAGDLLGTTILAAHFLLATVWLAYLWNVRASRPAS